MKNAPSIALIGDSDPTVTAHEAIPAALTRATVELDLRLNWTRVHTMLDAHTDPKTV